LLYVRHSDLIRIRNRVHAATEETPPRT
jgi:hypothetical protein